MPGDEIPCLEPGDCLELYGSSGSGRTGLLLNMVAEAILPSRTPNSHRKSKEGKNAFGHVVYVDVGGRLRPERLHRLLCDKLRGTGETAETSTEKEAEDLMESVHLYRCYDPQQLSDTLKEMEERVLKRDVSVALLVVDGINAFHWLTAAGLQSLEGPAVAPGAASTMTMASQLKRLARDYGLLLVYARHRFIGAGWTELAKYVEAHPDDASLVATHLLPHSDAITNEDGEGLPRVAPEVLGPVMEELLVRERVAPWWHKLPRYRVVLTRLPHTSDALLARLF